jgi:hypothetical protein
MRHRIEPVTLSFRKDEHGIVTRKMRSLICPILLFDT